jgi:hypothetical protein
MRNPSRQQGLTFWGLVFVLAVMAAVVLIGLRMFPVYMEAFKVQQALEQLASLDDLSQRPAHELHDLFLRRMEVEDVDRFNRQNLRKHMDIERKDKRVTITLRYTAEAELFGNLSVVADWNKQVTN